MDSSSIIAVAAIIVAAIVIVVILLLMMRARQRKADALPHPDGNPLTVDEEEYLDSSHIISGNDPRHPDPSARAAGALRKDKPRA